MSPRGVNLLGDVAKDANQGLVVFPAIDRYRLKKQAEKIEKYDWKLDGYKLHPSSLDFSMCPIEYVEQLKKGKFHFKPNTLELMEDGTSKHQQMQEILLKID